MTATSDDDKMAGLPERLRRAAPFMRASGYAGIVGQHANTCEEAADTLERAALALGGDVDSDLVALAKQRMAEIAVYERENAR